MTFECLPIGGSPRHNATFPTDWRCMDARPANDNPLGLNLDFLYGRGYLWAEHENVSDWVTLERLRMEIPDLSFPFDVRGGLSRFRDTRCLLRELDLRLSEVGLVDVLRRSAADLEGFDDLEIRFLDGVILLSLRVRTFGNDTFVTFKLGAMPGDAGSDTVRLLAHDFRAYGPLPCSGRQLVHTILRHTLDSDAVGALGRGTSFASELQGDSIVIRPLKLLLLHVFAQHGWKLPNLSRVVMGDLICRPGGAVLRARSLDEQWKRDQSTGNGSAYLAAALAADEARGLFERGDVATFAGRNEEALRAYQSFQDRYGTHPGLVRRLLDVLLLDPTPANQAEAEALCRDLENRNGLSLVAAIGRARLAELSGTREEAIERWSTVSELLAERGETLDRTLCDVVVARLVAETDPKAAAERLVEALRSEPRNRSALIALRDIYARLGDDAELEDVLKRLTGVAPDTRSLVETYVALAQHLMYRRDQVGEARAFLERALRAAPDRFEVLDALGESWVLSGDPARAVKTLGSAATAARLRGDYATASRLLARVGHLWADALGNREQALMQVRRALDLWEESAHVDPLERASQLRYAASLCEQDGQHSEAIANWTEALAALQLAEAQADALGGVDRVDVRRALAGAHRDIARAYRQRGRNDVALSHERRLVEMDPTDMDALDALEDHFRKDGGIEALVQMLSQAVARVGSTAESLAIRTRLAERQAELGATEEAIETLQSALEVAPGAERVRRVLASLLVEAGQPERLRTVLESLLERVQQRDVRWAISVELGDLAVDLLQDAAAAAAAYSSASQILPARPEAYAWCRFMMERLAGANGWDASSPLGGTLSEDLLALWQRHADNAPSAEERARIQQQCIELADNMGETTTSWAQTSINRPAPINAHTDTPFPHVDNAMLEDSWSETEDVAQPRNQFARQAATRLVRAEDGDAHNNKTAAPWTERDDDTPGPWHQRAPTGFGQAEIETLEVSRFAPPPASSLTSTDESEANHVAAPEPELAFPRFDSSPRLVADGHRRADEEEEPVFEDLDSDPRHGGLLGATRQKADPAVEAFRSEYDQVARRPPALAELGSVAPDSPLGRVLRRNKTKRAPSVEDETRGAKNPVALRSTSEKAPVVASEDIEAALRNARKSADDSVVAAALERLLETDLPPDRRAELSFELAELLYYELEDNDRALEWLLELRKLDPAGYGARPSILNAIEAVYEERGSIDGRIEILKARLEAATNDDLADTYRLLLAQLEWEERRDEAAAKKWLQSVLQRDDRHEGARRLLAEVDADSENWADAAEHLRIALSVAGDGLDSIELEKRLANILLDRLHRPEDALVHFAHTQQHAPHDTAITDGIRRCHAAIGDWEQYLSSLKEELRLLLGLTLPAEDDASGWFEELQASDVSTPLRVPASQILGDIARVLQDEQEELPHARRLWGTVRDLWPEHIEALERCIDLDRQLEHHEALIGDLEEYAAVLLDSHTRLKLLLEAATVRAEQLDDAEGAIELLEQALSDHKEPDEDDTVVHKAREALERWTSAAKV